MMISLRSAAIPVLLLALLACSPETPDSTPQTGHGADQLSALQPITVERSDKATDGVPQVGYCSLDTVNQQPVGAAALKVGDEAIFVGWAGDSAGEVSNTTQLVLSSADRVYLLPVQVRIDRPDVVEALGQPGLAGSGFGVATVLAVEPGDYRISALMGAPPDSHCQFDVELTITTP